MRVISKRFIGGFTIIEMLISIALSLLLLTGVLGAYISSFRASKSMRDRIGFQQDARFAMASLSKDIRMAGTFGCALPGNNSNLASVESQVTGDGATSWANLAANSIGISLQPILGANWINASGFVPEGKALIIQYGEGLVDAERQSTNNNIRAVLNPDRPQFNANSRTLALANCKKLYLFNGSGSRQSGNNFSISPSVVPALDANAPTAGWQLMRLNTVAYSVGKFNNRKGLYLFELDENGHWSGPKEIAFAGKAKPEPGKPDQDLDMSLDVEFGVSDCKLGKVNDVTTNFYNTTNVDWSNVSLVHITLTMQRYGLGDSTGKEDLITRTYDKTIALRRGILCIQHG